MKHGLRVALLFHCWILSAQTPMVDSNSIDLRSGRIDTSKPSGTLKSDGPKTSEENRFRLLQFEGPVRSEWVAGCEREGIRFHFYLPNFAYLVSSPTLEEISSKSLPHVHWLGQLTPDLKISPELKTQMQAKSSLLNTRILSLDDSTPRFLKDLSGDSFRFRKTPMGWTSIRAELSPDQIRAVAELDGVFHIEIEPEFKLHGERSAQTVAGNLIPSASGPIGPGYLAWLNQQGLTGGEGRIVQVQDDGLDQGIATNLPGTIHPDLLGRVAGILNVTSDPLGDSQDGHGQINAGILVGNASIGTTDSQGFLLGQGVVPNAKVFATKIFRNGGRFDLGGMSLSDLAIQAQNIGATFSSNSWGAVVAGIYLEESAEIDHLVRDCDPIEPGHQPMVYFFSAGNEGPDPQSIGAPGTAKNIITVGAGENSDRDGVDGCGILPDGADDVRDLIHFSSRGPLADGRIGPTVFTVGTHVQGPASTSPTYNGSAVCDKYWPLGQTFYARSSGTSHSTPLACGAGMLIAEFFDRVLSQLPGGNHLPQPSPAMIRAALANTSTDQAGGGDGRGGALGFVPSQDQGWGAINLGRLFSMKNGLFTSDQQHLFTDSGQTWETLITVVDPSKPLKITLAWSDAPGLPNAGKALVNDLDLTVFASGETLFGNRLADGFSVAGGERDRLNNLESIYIENPEENYFLQVSAYNIAGDGVPGNDSRFDQDFALFVWNGTDRSSKGNLSFAKSRVQCEDTFQIVLSDTDLTGTGSVTIPVVSSLGEQVLLSLVESTASGAFVGSVSTTLGTSSEETLGVFEGVILAATYEDLDDGEGNPRTASARAEVDCTPPTFSNLIFEVPNSYSAKVSLDTNEGANVRIEYGTDCQFLDQETFGGGTSRHEILIGGLLPETRYFIGIELEDFAGNRTRLDNDGLCYSIQTGSRGHYFSEVFRSHPFDLNGRTLTFTPAESSDSYEVCIETESLYREIPAEDRVVATLFDDSFTQIGFSGGNKFPFFGEDRDEVFLSSNGVLSFDAGTVDWDETIEEHFGLPQISALYDDLNPPESGSVYYAQYPDRFVVTYDGIPEYRTQGANTFQVELYWDGIIRIHYPTITSLDGIVGLSLGKGLPPDFVADDLSESPLCLRQSGFVRFTEDDYSCGEYASILVGDLDLSGAGVQEVTLTSTLGDMTFLFLQETSQGSGVFKGEVLLDDLSGWWIPGDDLLQVDLNDRIEVAYMDEDDGSGASSKRTASAYVNCRNEFNTERFESRDFDLSFHTLRFTPLLEGHSYRMCVSEATGFPVELGIGQVRPMLDDQSIRIDLQQGRTFPFFGQSFSRMYLGSNGYLTFGQGDSDFSESVLNHFDFPRVSFFFRDLDPGEGGEIEILEDDQGLTVTFSEIPEHTFGGSNSVQTRLYWNGAIDMTYLSLTSRNGLVGLSPGGGIPEGFQESNLSENDCLPELDPQGLLNLIRAIDAGILSDEDLFLQSLLWMD